MIAETVYILSAVTCMVCTILLWRGYRKSGTRLLMWSTLCFLMLTVANLGVYIDLIVLPEAIDLSPYRALITLAGLLTLLFGLIWETI